MRTYDQSCDQVADHNRLFDRIENDGGHRRHAQDHAQVFKEAMGDELEQHRSPPESGRIRLAGTTQLVRSGNQVLDEPVVAVCS